MDNDDDDTLRRMLGIKLVEAARKAGADLDAPPASAPPRPPADKADARDDFSSH